MVMHGRGDLSSLMPDNRLSLFSFVKVVAASVTLDYLKHVGGEKAPP